MPWSSSTLDKLTFCATIVMMSNERLATVLDAAYQCFTRYGIRRTTMEDIAAAAGMSRPALYQYVRGKDDAYRKLAARLFQQALAMAEEAAHSDLPLGQRLAAILSAKLDLTVRLTRDSAHAAELLGAGHLIADLADRFTTSMAQLVASVLAEAGIDRPAELAELAVALTRGIEADLSDPQLPYQRLRLGLDLLVAGAAQSKAAQSKKEGIP